MISPIHELKWRSAALKTFWSLTEANIILSYTLTSSAKKMVGGVVDVF